MASSSVIAPRTARNRLHRFYRGTLFQCIIAGVVSFANPGIWNALNALGAGGEEKPYLVNAANAITFGIMIVGCTIGGAVSNKIGLKWTLVLGTLGYPFYSASLYTNNRYGNEWFVLVGAVTCGLSASMLWASEAAIVLSYPEHHKRGRYVAIWLAIRGGGSLIGGAINLALNASNDKTGKVGYGTYLVLIAIQCLGFPFALLLSPPKKVIRDDGTAISVVKQTSWLTESKAIGTLLKSRKILLLIPIFIASQWGSTAVGNYFTDYFTVRSRALGSFLVAIAGICGDICTGLLLDNLPVSRSRRAFLIWLYLVLLIVGLWCWLIPNEVLYSQTTPSLDWASPGFGRGFAVYVIWSFSLESMQTFLYWMMGTLDDGVGTLARTTGLLRSFESVGSTCGYVTSATHWKLLNTMILSFVVFAVQIPFTTTAVWMVGDSVEKKEEKGGDEEVVLGGSEDKEMTVKVTWVG